MAINNPVITDSDWLQATAVAIQNKDGGGKIEVPDFASRIDALNVTDKWELLNEVILDEDVSIIKIDISAYKNDYSAFLVAPQLTPSNHNEWFYVGGENEKGTYVKGQYNKSILGAGAFEYPNYFGYYSTNLQILVPNDIGGGSFYPFSISDTQSIVISLYESPHTFLSGGNYKLYGKKTEDYLNVN